MIGKLFMAILSWLGGLFGGKTTSAPTQTTPLPGLPTGSVAAVAGALIESARIAEQQTALRNTPAMQQAAESQKQQNVLDKTKQDIANENVNATRNDFAE